MSSNGAGQDDLARRLSQLSPERRALLEKMLRAGGANAAPAPAVARANGVAPLSYAQEFLWLLERSHPGLAAYNVPRAFRVRGVIDAAALALALTDVVEQHALLRTRIDSSAPDPVQRVVPAEPVVIERVRATEGAEVERLLREHARRSFDLERDQLLRALLIDVGGDEHVFQFVVHHIASDGWSRTLTLRDLSAAYASRRKGAAPQLEAAAVTYADWAALQRSAAGVDTMQRDLAFWRETLSGAPAMLDLPVDRPRGRSRSFDGARIVRRLPARLRNALTELAHAHGSSRFMVTLAAYAALLHRYTNQDDVLIGSPVAGRANSDVQDVVGLFANTLVLRVSCEGDPSFAQLVERARDAALSAYEHQELPFERLAGDARATEGGSSTALLQTIFSLHDGEAPSLVLDGTETVAMEVEPGWSKVELTFGLADQPDGFVLLAEYRTDLFDRRSIERLMDHYVTLLEAVAADPGVRLSALELLSPGERAEILALGHGASVALPLTTVQALVEQQCIATPEAVAVSDVRGQLTYRELDERANRLAHYLAASGVTPGAAVGICLPRDTDMLVALLGTLKAGAHYVPLDPDYPADRLAFIAEDAALAAVVMTNATSERLPSLTGNRILLDADADVIARQRAGRLDVTVSPEAPMYVLHTSGSSGKPKGVMVPQRAVVNFLRSMKERPGLSAHDAIVAVTTLSFDIAGLELWLPLTVGARVVIAERSVAVDGRALAQLLDRALSDIAPHRGIVMLQATPATWRLLLDAGWVGSPRLRMLCGGEAWPSELAEALLPRGESLWNMYGPTETTIWSSVAQVTSPDHIVLGDPIANTTLYVVDSRLAPVPLGVAGELCIGGAGVALGYLNRPDLTAERFVRDPFSADTHAQMYRTGDLVRRTSAGALEYLGRLDQQVKIRGFRIELGEIELALRNVPGVAAAVVDARATQAGEQQLVAYVVWSGPNAFAPDLLQAALRATLPDHMTPASYVRLDALPLTANGKINRRALRNPTPADRASAPEFVAPSTDVERAIASVWQDVLGVSAISINDDFFSIGGHSLLAMRVVARLAQQFTARVTIGDLFTARTVRAFAALLQERTASLGASAAHAGNGTGHGDAPTAHTPRPLSRAQELLWIYEQRTPGTSAYNIPLVRHVRGTLDLAKLQGALDAMVDRHEALRTSVFERNGAPQQQALPPRRVPIELHDLRAAGANEQMQRAHALLKDNATRPFDLPGGTFPRALLLQLGESEWIVLFVFHHIVFDGASAQLFLRELAALYDGTPLPPLRMTGTAHAPAAGDAQAAATQYWTNYLDGATLAIDLVPDSVIGVADRQAERLVVTWPRARRDAVRHIAQATSATPYIVLIAALQSVLHRYTGQRDLLVGSPVSARDDAELEGVIGYLVDTVPLRARFERSTTFADVVTGARDGLAAAFQHRETSIAALLAGLGSGSGGLEVMLSYQQQASSAPHLGSAILGPYSVELETAKFSLLLSITDVGDGLRISAEYRADLFEAATIERLIGHLAAVVDGVTADAAVRVASVPLATAEDRVLLQRMNATSTPYPRDALVHDLFAEQVRLHPDAIAVESDSDRVTYSELDARSDLIARSLASAGVSSGDLVGLCVERSPALIAAILGILKAGAAYVPLDPQYPVERLLLMLDDAQASVAIADSGAGDILAAAAGARPLAQLIVDRAGAIAGASPADRKHDGGEPDPGRRAAYVMYTSGSTGRPKGVVVPHRAIVRLVKQTNFASLGAGERILAFAPISFDASTLELWGALLNGGTVVLAERGPVDVEALAHTIERHGVTTMWLTAALFRQMADSPALSRLKGVRQLLAGGDVLAPAYVRRVQDALPATQLINGYGPTENTTFTCCFSIPPAWPVERPVPIGSPVANTRVRILDEYGSETPVGVPGELYAAGDGVALGYLNAASLTGERFVNEPGSTDGSRAYRTGDRARWRADGVVEFLGRLDEQVKIRGYRVEPGEVESMLALHPDVREAAVVVNRSGDDISLVAYFASIDGTLRAQALRAWLRERLPEYLVPAQLHAVRALPVGPTGKVDRKALSSVETVTADEEYVSPRTDVERVIASIFAGILDHDRIGVDTSFLDLGGHSLLATRAVAQISRVFRMPLTLRAFFATPTVSGIARSLDGERPGQAAKIAAVYLQLQSMTPEQREALRAARGATETSGASHE